MRRLGRGAAALTGILLTLAIAEGVVRLWGPTPRVQVVRPAQVQDLREVGGAWLWRARNDQPEWRADRACLDEDPARPAVVWAGSSIAYGVRLAPQDAPVARLREQLAERWGERVCVVDVSQAGFVATSKVAAIQEALSTGLRPVWVLAEVWVNDLGTYQRVGEALYNFDGLVTDLRGRPRWPVGMPPAVRGWLFDRSALFAYAATTLAASRPGASAGAAQQRAIDEAWEPLRSSLDSDGVSLALWTAAPMGAPLEEAAVSQADEGHYYRRLRDWAQTHEVPVWSMAEAWADRDPVSVRIDPCCHLNASGADLLAADLVGWLEAHMEGREGP